MTSSSPVDPHDDLMLFMPADEAAEAEAEAARDRLLASKPWVLLVVDDDADVHSITRLVMHDFAFRDRRVELLQASSASEGRELLRQRSDIAVVLLDVVMESEHAGLELAQWIREDLGNSLVRIILRTGQPGQAPERDVIVRYDINDYKEKAELTADHLFSAVISAMRAYEDLLTIEEQRQTLEIRVAERTRELRLVLNSLGEGIVGCDQKGMVTFANPLLADMLDCTPESLIGQPVEKAVPIVDDSGAAHPMRSTLEDGQGRHTSDVTLASPLGEFPVDYLTTPILDDGVLAGAVCALRNVTDRRQAYDALGQQFSLLRAVSASLTVGLLWTDRFGTVLDCNARACDVLGCTPDELFAFDSFAYDDMLGDGLSDDDFAAAPQGALATLFAVLRRPPAVGEAPLEVALQTVAGVPLTARVSSYADNADTFAGCVVELLPAGGVS